MKVLQILPDLGLGGAERMAAQLSVALYERGVDVRVVSLYATSDTVNEHALSERGVPIAYLNKKLGFDMRMYPRLQEQLVRWRPHVVHTHRYVLRYCLPFLARPRSRWIHTVHNLAHREVGREGKIIHKIAFAAGVTPVAIADEVQKSINSVYKIHNSPLIPNGIDLKPFAEISEAQGRSWRERHGIKGDTLMFLSVGRLTIQKNHPLLLRAFARVANALPHALLTIVGDGELRPALEALADELGVRTKVRFLGRRSDVTDILVAADVFVMSSAWEGHPISIMEAMASGTPTVATAVGGVPELVVPGETGLLVQPGDTLALTNALLQIGSDRSARLRMGRNAREAARQFSVEQMAERYLALYDQIR